MEVRLSSPVLSALQISAGDRIISVQENHNADSNFVLTHIIKQTLHENNCVCLVSFHNSVDHYNIIGKKIGYDLIKAVENKEVHFVNILDDIVDAIGLENGYFQEEKENIVKYLYVKIKKVLDELLTNNERRVYLIIDDLSHLSDLAIELYHVITFVDYCVEFTNNDRINVVLNNHVSSKIDEIISNNLHYIADVHVEVSGLRTGRSQEVTGVLSIERMSQKKFYHYKAFDRGIKTFHPGESIYHLYK